MKITDYPYVSDDSVDQPDPGFAIVMDDRAYGSPFPNPLIATITVPPGYTVALAPDPNSNGKLDPNPPNWWVIHLFASVSAPSADSFTLSVGDAIKYNIVLWDTSVAKIRGTHVVSQGQYPWEDLKYGKRKILVKIKHKK